MSDTAKQYASKTHAELLAIREIVGEVARQQIDAELLGRAKKLTAEQAKTTAQQPPLSTVEPIVVVLEGLSPTKNQIHMPVIHHTKGYPMIVLTPEARAWKKAARAQAQAQVSREPFVQRCAVTLNFEVHEDRTFDRVNLTELLFDSLEGVCYENDKQIWDHHIHIRTTTGPERVYVTVEAQQWVTL
jgi:hypothetical protein